MLLALAQWLAQDVRGFNVFNYITLRTVLADVIFKYWWSLGGSNS